MRVWDVRLSGELMVSGLDVYVPTSIWGPQRRPVAQAERSSVDMPVRAAKLHGSRLCQLSLPGCAMADGAA